MSAPPYIPAIPFGYDQSVPPRPADWSSPVAGYYFVSAAGDDANGNGTPSAPRRTIPQGLGPGQRIEFAPGETYGIGSGGNLNFTGAGTGAAWFPNVSGPIWFVTQPGNPCHLITLDGFLRGSYLWLDGLYFDAVLLSIGVEADGFPADHIMVRNCQFVGTGLEETNRSALVIQGFDSGSNVDGVVVMGCTMRNWGNINSVGDVDACGTIMDTWVLNVWYFENLIHTCSGSGIRVGGAFENTQSPFNTVNIWVFQNEFYNCRQAGCAVKFADLTVFAENRCHDIMGGPGGPGCGLFAQYGPLNLWWVNNFSYNNEYGILVASTNTTVKNSAISADVPGIFYLYAVGNVIWNCLGDSAPVSDFSEAGIRMFGGTYRHIVNNTIYGCASGIICNGFAGTQADGGFFLENNIVDNVIYPSGNHLWFVNELTNSTVINSIFFQPAGTPRFVWGGGVLTLAQFQVTSGTGDDCSVADPLFTDAANDDFTLTAASPAIGDGIASTVYDTYDTDVGVPLTVDIAGNPRPTGGTFDDGAYEYVVTGAPVINSPTTAEGIENVAFSYQITTSGGTPSSYGAIGLPTGLSIDTATGLITGTPTTAGVSNITLSATNGDGSDTSPLVLTVSDPVTGIVLKTQSGLRIRTQGGAFLLVNT